MRLNIAKTRSEEESRLKSSFLARMSHEIRTPMNAIIGLSELAERDYGTPVSLGYLADIRKAGGSLLGIINDILDLSKIQSGKFRLASEHYRTSRLISDVLSVSGVKAREKGLALESVVDPTIPRGLVGDPLSVQQVLLNLLSNAVKFTAKGRVKLTCGWDRLDLRQILLVFTVEDTGEGIRQEDIESLFGDFVRVEDWRHGSHVEGTGLGLSISKSICRMMDGDIAVESIYGQGSAFTATFRQEAYDLSPIGDAEQPDDSADAPSGAFVAPFRAPGCSMLVVDDIRTNLVVAEGLLYPYQMRVVTCQTGEEALEECRKSRFDVLLVDQMMPGLDGYAVMKLVREIDEHYRTAPIVAFTANAVAGTREALVTLGFTDYLSKPVNSRELCAILERWVPESMRIPAGAAGDGQAPALMLSADDAVSKGRGGEGGPDDDAKADRGMPASGSGKEGSTGGFPAEASAGVNDPIGVGSRETVPGPGTAAGNGEAVFGADRQNGRAPVGRTSGGFGASTGFGSPAEAAVGGPAGGTETGGLSVTAGYGRAGVSSGNVGNPLKFSSAGPTGGADNAGTAVIASGTGNAGAAGITGGTGHAGASDNAGGADNTGGTDTASPAPSRNGDAGTLPSSGDSDRSRPVHAGLPPALYGLPGYDPETGLGRTGGSPGVYLKVLKVFLTDAEDYLNYADAREPGDPEFSLVDLKARTHAIKSALGGIGATALQAEALFLETSAKAGDSGPVKNGRLAAFEAELAELKEHISAALSRPSGGIGPLATAGSLTSGTVSSPVEQYIQPGIGAVAEASRTDTGIHAPDEAEGTPAATRKFGAAGVLAAGQDELSAATSGFTGKGNGEKATESGAGDITCRTFDATGVTAGISPEDLAELRSAVAEGRLGDADRLIDRLNENDGGEGGDFLDKVSDLILVSDYQEAIRLMDEISSTTGTK
ncbi:MAG: response regulator [Deltaproteobacteria bacterium]|nr:response regulator [Deltaproteobacteria bacterium]